KHGSYYARWRTSDGRKLNRKVGPVRPPGTSDGLTRSQAERLFQKMQEVEETRPSRRRGVEPITVSAAASSLRRAKALEGTRKSYLENLESMQRVHVDPSIGPMPLEKVSTDRIETLASGLLGSGRSPKTVRNLLTFLYSVFEHAIANGGARRTLSAAPPARSGAAPGTPAPCSGRYRTRWSGSVRKSRPPAPTPETAGSARGAHAETIGASSRTSETTLAG
ncbi:MAG: hypothetical protein ACTHQQ_06100, partial [Solirubrobacteraceae bacterium]